MGINKISNPRLSVRECYPQPNRFTPSPKASLGPASLPKQKQEEGPKATNLAEGMPFLSLDPKYPELLRMIMYKVDENSDKVVSLRGSSKQCKKLVDACLKSQINVTDSELGGMLKAMTALYCISPGFEQLSIKKKVSFLNDNLKEILGQTPELGAMLRIITEGLQKRGGRYFFDGCSKVRRIFTDHLDSWTYCENTTQISIGELRVEKAVCGGIFKKAGFGQGLGPIENGIFAMKISRQINQRLFGVSLLSNFELKASTGVTKTQTSTNANGEKIVDCWENVNVDANGEIMASTRCVRTQATTKTNGEKIEGRWENVNIGAKGLMIASTGVIKKFIIPPMQMEKKKEARWKMLM